MLMDVVFLGDSWIPFVAMIHHCKKFDISNPWATPLLERKRYADRTIQGSSAIETLKNIHSGLDGLVTSRDTQWFIGTGSHDVVDWNFREQGEHIANTICNIVQHIVVHQQARKICITSIRCDPTLVDALGFLYPFTKYTKVKHVTFQINAPLLEKMDELRSLYPNVTFHLYSQQVSYTKLLMRWMCELYIIFIHFLHVW